MPANQGGGVEIKMRIPPGNYEIEAITRLYNNSDSRVIYTGTLEFYLEDNVHFLWEGGEMGSTVDSKPHILHFRTMSYFSKTKLIRFKIQSSAVSGFLADGPCVFVRRTGSIRFEAE